jgi:hypothetical protein
MFEEREYGGASEGFVGELIGHFGPDYGDEIPGPVRIQQFPKGPATRWGFEQRWSAASEMLAFFGLLG